MRAPISALFLLLWMCLASLGAAQVTIEGQVLDENGRTLPGVNVYLAGSTIGAATDSEGRFRLVGLSTGVHRVRASMVGFGLGAEDVVARTAGRHVLQFRLSPAEYALGEVVVRPMGPVWQRRLARFTTALIGQSSFADEVRILNPEVLDFSDRAGRLTAVAHAPLRIENRALGYLLRYDLTHFEATANRIEYDGEPYFEELEPANEAVAARWRANRATAFAGSQTHFFRALYHDRLEEEGFLITLMPEGGRAAGARFTPVAADPMQRRVRPRAVLRHQGDGTAALSFRGLLAVTFDHPEDAGIVRWDWNVEGILAPRNLQGSEIYMRERSVLIDARGEIAEPLGIRRRGYLAFRRLAMMMPVDYGLEGQ